MNNIQNLDDCVNRRNRSSIIFYIPIFLIVYTINITLNCIFGGEDQIYNQPNITDLFASNEFDISLAGMTSLKLNDTYILMAVYVIFHLAMVLKNSQRYEYSNGLIYLIALCTVYSLLQLVNLDKHQLDNFQK